MLAAAEEKASAGRAIWLPPMADIVVSPARRGEHDRIVQLRQGIQAWALPVAVALPGLARAADWRGRDPLWGRPQTTSRPTGWHSPVDAHKGGMSRRHKKPSQMLPPAAAGDLWGVVVSVTGPDCLPEPTSRRLGQG